MMNYAQQEALNHLYDAMYFGPGSIKEAEVGTENLVALEKRTLAKPVAPGMWRITLLGVIVNRAINIEDDVEDVVSQLEVVSEPVGEPLTLRDAVWQVVDENPGIRSPQVSTILQRPRSSVTDALSSLWKQDRVTRVGAGTTADPFRYQSVR